MKNFLVHAYFYAREFIQMTQIRHIGRLVILYCSKPDLPSVQLGEGNMGATDRIKSLRLTLDQNLNFKPLINTVLNKLSKSVGFIYRIIVYLQGKTLFTVCHSLIYPFLSYGFESWHSVTNTMCEIVLIFNKRAIRSAYESPYNGSTNAYFKQLNVLKIPEI